MHTEYCYKYAAALKIICCFKTIPYFCTPQFYGEVAQVVRAQDS